MVAVEHDLAVASPSDRREVFRNLPFPFPNDQFPSDLGAVIQRTVFDGDEPAREVIHNAANHWLGLRRGACSERSFTSRWFRQGGG
jgi:hypothetical protein